MSYSDDYFISDYRRQYGKTYEEDYSNIYRASKRRLEIIIDKYSGPSGPKDASVLDIGSALGFFLKAARDMGFGDVQGVEISDYASDYCIKNFGISTISRSFDEVYFEKSFNVITAWYFIEHSIDPDRNIRRIYSMLKNGGIFAFSMPSFFGPMFYFNKKKWSETHPVDHSIDISPFMVKKYLKSVGFSKVYTWPGGIHPERVLPKDKFYFPLFAALYEGLSNRISFSDTLEIYAIKGR